MFDSNTCSFILMLEVKPIVDGELEILYKRIYESNETTILNVVFNPWRRPLLVVM